MKDYIEERALEIADYIINRKSTVRAATKAFGVSKTTVHRDVTERLPKINPAMALRAKRVLDENKAERHIRGGIATKAKWEVCRHENIQQ